MVVILVKSGAASQDEEARGYKEPTEYYRTAHTAALSISADTL